MIDRATPPIDKACGEGLLPAGIALLARLGIRFPSDVGFRFSGIRFSDSHSSVAADFPAGQGIGLRRTHLHTLLLERARALDIPLHWDVKQVGLRETSVTISGVTTDYDYVLAADGQHSQIRRDAGLDESLYEHRRYGFRRHYRVTPWSSQVEVYWGPNCQIYITPVAPDEIGVALLSRDPQFRLAQALAHFPELAARLASAEHASREMGCLSISRKFRRISQGRLALLGDASGSVDAVTGEGLCLSFQQAFALVHAIDSRHLAIYQRAHDELSRRPRLFSSLLLTLDQHPLLRRCALAGFARFPSVFSACLAVHAGHYAPVPQIPTLRTTAPPPKASFKHG